MRKQFVIALFVVAIVGLAAIVGLVLLVIGTDPVRVTDAATGQPIRGAEVRPVYAGFGGSVYLTDAQGIARIGGFGLRNLYSVDVSAPGYEPRSISMHISSTNHLDVALAPTPRP
jgi:hypothetical protein